MELNIIISILFAYGMKDLAFFIHPKSKKKRVKDTHLTFVCYFFVLLLLIYWDKPIEFAFLVCTLHSGVDVVFNVLKKVYQADRVLVVLLHLIANITLLYFLDGIS